MEKVLARLRAVQQEAAVTDRTSPNRTNLVIWTIDSDRLSAQALAKDADAFHMYAPDFLKKAGHIPSPLPAAAPPAAGAQNNFFFSAQDAAGAAQLARVSKPLPVAGARPLGSGAQSQPAEALASPSNATNNKTNEQQAQVRRSSDQASASSAASSALELALASASLPAVFANSAHHGRRMRAFDPVP